MNEEFGLLLSVLRFAFVFSILGLGCAGLRLLKASNLDQPAPSKGSSSAGIVYALGVGMLPWKKECGQLHPIVYWVGVFFHIGIFLSFIILLLHIVNIDFPVWLGSIAGYVVFWAAAVGIVNLVKRALDKKQSGLNSSDDYVSVLLVSLFMFSAWSYVSKVSGPLFFEIVSIGLLLYLPFSKLKHMLFFFISKGFHGAKLGKLGIYGGASPVLTGGYYKDVVETAYEPAEEELKKIEFTDEQCKELGSGIESALDRETTSMIKSCVHCYMCKEACHYYLSTGDESLIPVAKVDKMVGNCKITPDKADEIHQAAFKNCSLCGRCAMSCPMGINSGEILSKARVAFSAIGASPAGLIKPAQTAIDVGNYLNLTTEDVEENIEWIGEELSDELEQEGIEIPLDVQNADVLFIPHPIELRDMPMMVMATAKIFHKAAVNYTFSKEAFDTVNYAFYSGNKEHMKGIIERVVNTAEKLGAKSIVLSPCGHGYRVLRWEAEKLLGRKLPFEVFTLSEVIDKYVSEGKLKLKKDTFEGKITYHDPCNIGRNGGVLEEPRRVLKTLSTNFVEMQPFGAWNYCCGGGGGLAASPEYTRTKQAMGGAKAKQIKNCGAKMVVTNCFNCNSQIKELNKRLELGVEVKSITEIVSDSIE